MTNIKESLKKATLNKSLAFTAGCVKIKHDKNKSKQLHFLMMVKQLVQPAGCSEGILIRFSGVKESGQRSTYMLVNVTSPSQEGVVGYRSC